MESITELIMEWLPAIGAFLVPYIGWATHKIIVKVFGTLDAYVENKWLGKGIEIARRSVLATHQTIIQDLQRRAKDGDLTANDWKEGTAEAKREAIKMFKGSLRNAPKAVREVLEGEAGEMIESAVIEAKAINLMVGPVMDPLKGQVSK